MLLFWFLLGFDVALAGAADVEVGVIPVWLTQPKSLLSAWKAVSRGSEPCSPGTARCRRR